MPATELNECQQVESAGKKREGVGDLGCHGGRLQRLKERGGLVALQWRVTSQSLSPQGFSLISLQFSLYNFRIFRYVSKDFWGQLFLGGWLAGWPG